MWVHFPSSVLWAGEPGVELRLHAPQGKPLHLKYSSKISAAATMGVGPTETNISVWLFLVWPLRGSWPATQACALIENQTSDPLVCRLALDPLSHTSQGPSPISLHMSSPVNLWL